MKAKNFIDFISEAMDEISIIQELSDNEVKAAQKIVDFAEKIGEIEADRGAEADSVIIDLFDNNFVYDGEDQLKYSENVMGEKLSPTEHDIENAKRLWMLQEMSWFVNEVTQ